MRFGTRVTFHPQHPLYHLGIKGGIVVPPPANSLYQQAVWVRVRFEGFDFDCAVTPNDDQAEAWLDLSEPVSAQQLVIPA